MGSATTSLVTQFLLLLISVHRAPGFGSMGPISASFGSQSFYCAIDASGKQEVICWGNEGSSFSPAASYSSNVPVPPMAALSGGEGFMCGILANTSRSYCWTTAAGAGDNLVPRTFRSNYYSHIAAGKNHVCAIRGFYYVNSELGPVDCWEIEGPKNQSSAFSEIHGRSPFLDQYTSNLVFRDVVSGEGFTCGRLGDDGIWCWGPESYSLGIEERSEAFIDLVSGRKSLCGISASSKVVKCWTPASFSSVPPEGVQFVSLSAGSDHFCGIRKDDHGIECWGNFNASLVPKTSDFMAIASSDFTTCGIRENDLVLDCWYADTITADFDPPLQLCSPGLCTSDHCGAEKFSFNASVLSEPDLTNLCVKKDLSICFPCATNCSRGFFESSPCSESSDRACTPCSLCQNSSCLDVCGGGRTWKAQNNTHMQKRRFQRLIAIIASSSLSLFLVFVLLSRVKVKNDFAFCVRRDDQETETKKDVSSPSVCAHEAAQIFRLSELKDVTNGFKEFNELGRSRFGFVYKAVLADGRQVAVKRANAATIIHTNIRDFEMELEIRCKLRHSNIVNLLGYSLEMGERLLVYEYMLHGTLHDHLHGGLSVLNWNQRLKISMDAARGLEYLHSETVQSIMHGDVKTSNILLDSGWTARISDLGFHHRRSQRHLHADMKEDVYCFGIVLLEILSGRKAYDPDFTPQSIVEWSVPLMKEGRAAAMVDRSVALPRNVEPLLKLANIAERAVRKNLDERPAMSVVADWLEKILKGGFVF